MVSACRAEGVIAYADILSDELSGSEGPLEKSLEAIEDDQNNASGHPVGSFKPLSMGFIRVSRVTSIVAGSLCFGSVTV